MSYSLDINNIYKYRINCQITKLPGLNINTRS